jgi:hypothetical protein
MSKPLTLSFLSSTPSTFFGTLRYSFDFAILIQSYVVNTKQDNKIDLLHLIVVPQLSSGQQQNYSTKTSQEGRANEQPGKSHRRGRLSTVDLLVLTSLDQLLLL